MYFSNFPKIYYPFQIAGKEDIRVVVDITRNVRVIKNILDSITTYEYYDIVNEESPEIISERLYNTATYHWLLMILNDRYDYVADWPMSQQVLDKYVTEKYGVGNEYAVHHYVNNGFIVDATVIGAAAVSNHEYEESINDSKRTIKVLSEAMISKLAKQLTELIQ